jgi:hypothetical protein
MGSLDKPPKLKKINMRFGTWNVKVQGPVKGSCEHGNEPSGSKNVRKFLSSCTTGGFSRKARLHEVS